MGAEETIDRVVDAEGVRIYSSEDAIFRADDPSPG
jgi:hypothetical protein